MEVNQRGLDECLAFMQPQRAGLAAGAGFLGSDGDGEEKGLGCLALVNMNTCGVKCGETCTGSAVAVLAIGFFFSGKAAEFVCQAGHTELRLLLLCGIYW